MSFITRLRSDSTEPPHSDPATVERIWGERITGLKGGYTVAYNVERRVDERLLVRALSFRKSRGLALDVGSFYPETPKRLAGMGWSVVRIDLSEEVCRRVRQVSTEERLALRAVRCDAAMLPFRAGAFDLVTDFVTSVVTPDAASLVSEEVRVLKPDALYVLVSNNRWTRSGRYHLRQQKRAGNRHPRWGYFSPLSPYDLWSLTWKCDLRLISIDSEGHSLRVVGLWLSVVSRVCPFLKRVVGWRLGAAYTAQAREGP